MKRGRGDREAPLRGSIHRTGRSPDDASNISLQSPSNIDLSSAVVNPVGRRPSKKSEQSELATTARVAELEAMVGDLALIFGQAEINVSSPPLPFFSVRSKSWKDA